MCADRQHFVCYAHPRCFPETCTLRGRKSVRRAERREPSGTSFLYRQADACRSPIILLRTARSLTSRTTGIHDQFQSVISLLFDRRGQGTGVVRRVQGIHWFSMILRVLNRTIIDDQLGDNDTAFGTKIGLHDRLSYAGRMTPECLVQVPFLLQNCLFKMRQDMNQPKRFSATLS